MSGGTTSSSAEFINLGPEDGGWTHYEEGTYLCRVFLVHLPQGGLQATALRMPDVTATGSSETEAIERITEALTAAVRQRTPAGAHPPWVPLLKPPLGALLRAVVIHLHDRA